MSKIIAIDLGTSNSVVCANVGGVPTVIPNDLGSNTTPSAVAFKKNGEKLVGQLAKRQQITNFKNTFTSFKRLMGHTYEEVKDEKSSYTIKANDKGLAVAECPILDKDFTPEQLSSFVLGYLKKCAEDYLGETVTKAIVTVPAYFNQRDDFNSFVHFLGTNHSVSQDKDIIMSVSGKGCRLDTELLLPLLEASSIKTISYSV